MILSLLKAYKSIFYPRSIIIAINGKNAIETKRGANKSIFYNSFISFEILLNSFRLTINPSNEKNITKYKKSLPIIRLDLFIISLYKLITKSFFCTLKAFCFYVVFNERLYPIRITFNRPISYTLGINPKNFCEFINSQICFFKKLFKFLFIHYSTFIDKINYLIISNTALYNQIIIKYLTFYNHSIIILTTKNNQMEKGATKWKQQKSFQSVKIKR